MKECYLSAGFRLGSFFRLQCLSPVGREARGPYFATERSCFGGRFIRRVDGIAQLAHDQFPRTLGTPSLAPTLQGTQLRVVGVGFRKHRRQSLHQHLG